MATILTDVAQRGYQTSKDFRPTGVPAVNPFYAWSANWMGYGAGMALERSGYTKPVKSTMGRGYTVNVWTAANKFKVTFPQVAGREPIVDRVGEG